jgi:hypothetical protein
MGGGPSKSSKSSSLAQGKRTGLNESSGSKMNNNSGSSQSSASRNQWPGRGK